MTRTSFALLWALCVSACCASAAQDGTVSPGITSPRSTSLRRFEIGVDSAAVRTAYTGQGRQGCCPTLSLGLGASINLDHRFAIDTKLITTPGSSTSVSNFYGGRITEFLSGARAEIRARRYGYFVRAQAGFLSWDHVVTKVLFPTPNTFAFEYGSRTSFVSEVGGGVELAISDRMSLRAGVGDLLARDTSSEWSNSLQPSAGLYFGLGRPLAWKPPVYEARATHPFWDQWNVMLVTASVLAMTADSITTQRFIAQGQHEGDPLAAPLVKYGWSGQISLEGMETAGEILGIYGLHRIGRHWLERLVPGGIAAAHGVLAYQNTKASSRPPPAP
jgi:hypothetical protein